MPAIRTSVKTSRTPYSAPQQKRLTRDSFLVEDLSDSTSCSDFDESYVQRALLLPSGKSSSGRRQPSTSAHPSKSRVASTKCTADPITIKGITFHPTVVFDTFWRWAFERKAIDDRRRSGMDAPWSEDPIFQRYAFCNTFRVLDKLSQYIIREVIEKGSQEPNEVVFRVILFNSFTKIDTWELLDNELGPLTWPRYNRAEYQKVLTRAKRAGTTLYTGAFQKPSPKFEFKDAHINHLCLLEVLMESDLPSRLMNAKYLAEVYEYLLSFPSMGEFSTYQLLLNLMYTNVLNFSNMDFVIAGPGATSGLTKMFGAKKMKAAKHAVPGIEEDLIRWFAENQNAQFERLGLKFSGLGPDRLPMDLADIEHAMCEVDKYSRQAHPQFKGKSIHIRAIFHPSPGIYPPTPVLPKAWKHPDRKILRIWPGPRPTKDPRYVVSRIKAHRDGARGREYKVSWSGYTDADDTWEPEQGLLQDAPGAVNEYLASL